jgi:hypothetical protein
MINTTMAERLSFVLHRKNVLGTDVAQVLGLPVDKIYNALEGQADPRELLNNKMLSAFGITNKELNWITQEIL